MGGMQKQFPKEVRIAVGVIGLLQALFGFIFCIVCVVFATKSGAVASPFWTGIPLLLNGILGIVSAYTRNQCMLIAWLVINILLTIMLFISAAITGIASALLGWAMDIHKSGGANCHNFGDNCVCHKAWETPRTINGMSCDDLDSVHAILQCLTAFAVLGGFACFAGSIASCVALCCYKSNEQSVFIASQGGQAVVITQGNPHQQQPGIITYQPPQQQQQQQHQYPPPNQAAYPPPSYESQAPVMETKPAFVHVE